MLLLLIENMIIDCEHTFIQASDKCSAMHAHWTSYKSLCKEWKQN